jgi:hypothetical protein
MDEKLAEWWRSQWKRDGDARRNVAILRLREEMKSELTTLDCDAYDQWLADTGVESHDPWEFRG